MAVHSHQTAIWDVVTRLEQELVTARQLSPCGFRFGWLGFGFWFGLWFGWLGFGFWFGLWFFGLLGFGFWFGLWFFGLLGFGFGLFGQWRLFGLGWLFGWRFRNHRLDHRRRRSGRSRRRGCLWGGRDSARLEGL